MVFSQAKQVRENVICCSTPPEVDGCQNHPPQQSRDRRFNSSQQCIQNTESSSLLAYQCEKYLVAYHAASDWQIRIHHGISPLRVVLSWALKSQNNSKSVSKIFELLGTPLVLFLWRTPIEDSTVEDNQDISANITGIILSNINSLGYVTLQNYKL